MDPFVRATVHLQQLFLRLAGFLVAILVGVYLVAWTADPPPLATTVVVGVVLALNLAWHARAHWGKRRHEVVTEVDLGLFSGLTVLAYGAVLCLPEGLSGPFYPLVYVVMMAAAAYARPGAALLTVVVACALELALRVIALGESNPAHLWPRGLFLALFTVLNVALFHAEIARVRSVSRRHVQQELDRVREAARAYRLTGSSSDGSDDRALQSAVGEVQQAVVYALSLLRKAHGYRSCVLMALEGDQLSVFEAVSDRALKEELFSASEGLFSAALRRREPISVVGRRAATHMVLYAEPQLVGTVCVVPVLEGEHARGVLVVDREEERAPEERELEALAEAAHFILRAMQNERVFAALERSNREQGKLYRAAEALGAATTEAEVIDAGVESARQVAAFDFAAVTLFHRKTGSHEICAVSGEGAEELVGRSFRHNAGLVSMVVANRHALPYRGEYEPSRQTVFSRGFEPPKMPSLLVLPLLVHERVLGTLVLGSSERGAFNMSVRPALEVLASHMAVSLANARMVKRLEEQATTDGMTGLYNKRTLIAEAERRIKVAERFNKPLSVLVTDIDHFKRVNDTYGHDVGDVVIKGLGTVLRRIKRDTDVVGRFGGEEFVIVCEQTDETGAKNLAERIRRELEATTFQTEMGPLSVTASIGVSTFPKAGRTWESLFKSTDEALYVSKKSGRNQVTVWNPRLPKTSAA